MMVNSEEFSSPHEDEGHMEDIYREFDLVDDVNRRQSLDKKGVVLARMDEMSYFKK